MISCNITITYTGDPFAGASFRQENQYFSSDFPSASAECQHTHDPARAVLYSGAGNRLGEVLLDHIKRPMAAGQPGGSTPWRNLGHGKSPHIYNNNNNNSNNNNSNNNSNNNNNNNNNIFINKYIYIIWVNYNDLTATSLESWLARGIIPKWP